MKVEVNHNCIDNSNNYLFERTDFVRNNYGQFKHFRNSRMFKNQL